MSRFTELAERRWEGEFTLERWLSYLWAEATNGEDPSYRGSTEDDHGLAPPTLATIVAREAAGTTTIEAALSEAYGTTAEVMLGGHRVTFDRPLRFGETYRATAEILDHEERTGTTGAFSVVTMAYSVTSATGEPAFQVEWDFVVRAA